MEIIVHSLRTVFITLGIKDWPQTEYWVQPQKPQTHESNFLTYTFCTKMCKFPVIVRRVETRSTENPRPPLHTPNWTESLCLLFLSKHGAPSVDFLSEGQSNWLPESTIFVSANLTIFGRKFANSSQRAMRKDSFDWES